MYRAGRAHGNDIYGAAHAFDLPFLFGSFGPPPFANVANSAADRPGRLVPSNAMMSSLGAFLRDVVIQMRPSVLGTPWPAPGRRS